MALPKQINWSSLVDIAEQPWFQRRNHVYPPGCRPYGAEYHSVHAWWLDIAISIDRVAFTRECPVFSNGWQSFRFVVSYHCYNNFSWFSIFELIIEYRSGNINTIYVLFWKSLFHLTIPKVSISSCDYYQWNNKWRIYSTLLIKTTIN